MQTKDLPVASTNNVLTQGHHSFSEEFANGSNEKKIPRSRWQVESSFLTTRMRERESERTLSPPQRCYNCVSKVGNCLPEDVFLRQESDLINIFKFHRLGDGIC